MFCAEKAMTNRFWSSNWPENIDLHYVKNYQVDSLFLINVTLIQSPRQKRWFKLDNCNNYFCKTQFFKPFPTFCWTFAFDTRLNGPQCELYKRWIRVFNKCLLVREFVVGAKEIGHRFNFVRILCNLILFVFNEGSWSRANKQCAFNINGISFVYENIQSHIRLKEKPIRLQYFYLRKQTYVYSYYEKKILLWICNF